MINSFIVFEVKIAAICRKYGNQKLSCNINIGIFLTTADSDVEYGSKGWTTDKTFCLRLHGCYKQHLTKKRATLRRFILSLEETSLRRMKLARYYAFQKELYKDLFYGNHLEVRRRRSVKEFLNIFTQNTDIGKLAMMDRDNWRQQNEILRAEIPKKTTIFSVKLI